MWMDASDMLERGGDVVATSDPRIFQTPWKPLTSAVMVETDDVPSQESHVVSYKCFFVMGRKKEGDLFAVPFESLTNNPPEDETDKVFQKARASADYVEQNGSFPS